VLALRLGDRFGKGIRSAPRDALLAESVAANQRGTAFGIHRAADHLGAAIGPLIAAALLLAWPGQIRRVFAIAAIPGIVGALLVVWKVRETHTTAGEQPRAPEHSGAPFDPAFFRYLAVLLLFTLGNASDAFLLLRASELGVPMAAVPLLWSVHHVGKSLLSVPGGMFADRLGPRRAIAGGWLVYAAVYAAFAFAGEAWHAWALFVVYGIFHALTEAPEKALVAALAPAGRRGSAFGAYHGAIGVAALPASLIFGLLWARFGPTVPFLTGAALALAATLLLPITRTPAESSQ
jgi:MFS family permease